jgi:hypothetical protein
MTRLIVDDGGQRRAFKIQDGRLTVGSGPDASLRLAGGDVADLHLDLEVEGGRVKVRARPGVTPPLVDGRPAPGVVELAQGATLKIGAATLRVEYEGAAATPPAAAAAAARPAPARVPRRPKSVVQGRSARELHSSGRGLPGWAVALIVLALVGVAGFVASKVLTDVPTDNLGASATFLRVHELIKQGQVVSAAERLATIERDGLDDQTRAKYDAAAAALAAAQSEVDQSVANIGGSEFLQTQLKNFETQRLAGKAERPEVRVFLKRCAAFLERWPQHPEADWVRRMQERYAALIDPAARTTFEDIAFEAESLTWANPRDYKQALDVVRRFADEEATVDDRAKALVLLDQLTAQRAEWFSDRMQQARYEFDKGEMGKSVAWLVMLIEYTGDEGMAAQAAEQLSKFPGLTEWLRGYRSSQPVKYAMLKRQPVLAKYIADHKVEQAP